MELIMSKLRESLESSFLETVTNTELPDVAQDIGEIFLDTLFEENGIIKEIPLIKTLFGLAKAGLNVRDRLFAEKVLRFLGPVSKYSKEDRAKFLKELDPGELNEVGQYMVLYLDRLDSLQKPAMLGRVFEAYMLNKINRNHMLYFSHFIDSVFILTWEGYYKAIKAYHDKKGGSPKIFRDDALALEKVWFYEESHKPVERMDSNSYQVWLKGIERKLVLTDAGWQFIRIVFQLWPDEDRRSFHRSWLSVELKEK
jgi:hypothetical protein